MTLARRLAAASLPPHHNAHTPNPARNPRPPRSGFLSVPLEEYAHNLRTITTRLRAAGIAPLIVTPPPVNDQDGHFTEGARSNAHAGAYADAAVGVAKAMGLPHLDIWRKFQARARAAGFCVCPRPCPHPVTP